jgi:hypothetical protein
MTAREAAHRYSANDERVAVGFATALLHHWLGHDPEGLYTKLLPFPKSGCVAWLHLTAFRASG